MLIYYLKARMSSKIKRLFSVFCVVLLFSFSGYAATTDPDMDDTIKVNAILLVRFEE